MGIFHNMLQHIAASDAQEAGPYHSGPMPMQSWQQAPAPAQVVDHTSQHMRDMHVAVQGLQHQMKQLVALNMLTARPPQHVPHTVQPEVIVRDKGGKVAGKMKNGRFYKAIRTPDGAVAGIEGDPPQ